MHFNHFASQEPDAQSYYTLRDGAGGILQTASFMRELVDEYKSNAAIRDFALSLIADLPPKDETGEITRIFEFVRDGVRYVKDVYGVETLSTPLKLLDTRQGDCDDKSLLLATLLESIGYPTMFKLTGYNGVDFEHVYVFVADQNGGIHLDATEPELAGWEAPNPTNFVYVY